MALPTTRRASDGEPDGVGGFESLADDVAALRNAIAAVLG